MKSMRILFAVFCGLQMSFEPAAHAEQPNRARPLPAYLKPFVPVTAYYSFYMQKGNIVFLQVSNDPATRARDSHWPGGCASSRIINLSTGESRYIYEKDGSYFCSNYHHNIISSVEISAPDSAEIGYSDMHCSYSLRVVWVTEKRRYIIVKKEAVQCDPK